MIKYLIIQLDDTSVSFCHYDNSILNPRLIDIDVLKEAIFWSMKENATVQFLYPDYKLPETYRKLIDSIDHTDIVSSECDNIELVKKASIVVFDSCQSLSQFPVNESQSYVLRTNFDSLFENVELLDSIISKMTRLNIIITDVYNLNENRKKKYQICLKTLSEKIVREYTCGHTVQINILTDRIVLENMNNCGAGDTTITIAPDGNFYICPGFYIDNLPSVGNPCMGLDIKNQNLFRIGYAPICRICDSWHCKRCVLLNKNTTLEVNTPGKEQCVTSHLERNASKSLLEMLQKNGLALKANEISEISYLDPFDKLIKKSK